MGAAVKQDWVSEARIRDRIVRRVTEKVKALVSAKSPSSPPAEVSPGLPGTQP